MKDPPGWRIQLTLRFSQLFHLQGSIIKNRVGADVNGPTTRVDDQNLVARLQACENPTLDGERVTNLQVSTRLGLGGAEIETCFALCYKMDS